MKKKFLFLFIVIFSVSSWGYKISSRDGSRYNIDNFRGSFRMMKVDYDSFGDKKDSKGLGYYNYIPLYKNGEIVGYGAITHIKSYNKHEALLAIISPDGKLMDFYLPDANDKHQEVHDYNWKNSYIGKEYAEIEFDGLAGSTFIANSTYGELKSILRGFEFRKKDIVEK
ncbi:hypothetical protein [uncultured Ilyobacter sp.]|uniref:hypothetical protein n=1 Tax=uncultured Ilyobacter sp. TaxID=544433 RepID=UPI0029C04B20|nr:hypothetical protein [uncultured Ilyobacter sp.]